MILEDLPIGAIFNAYFDEGSKIGVFKKIKNSYKFGDLNCEWVRADGAYNFSKSVKGQPCYLSSYTKVAILEKRYIIKI